MKIVIRLVIGGLLGGDIHHVFRYDGHFLRFGRLVTFFHCNSFLLIIFSVYNCFFGRLAYIQREEQVNAVINHQSKFELEEQHEQETANYKEIFSLVQGAVEVPQYKAFFPNGYEQETIDTEIEQN